MPHHTPSRLATLRGQAGFSLLEAMIVLGLVAALLAVGATWLSYQSQSQQREGHTDALARDLAMLTGAVQKYLATNPPAVTALAANTTLPAGSTPTIAQLITDGHLPTNFANRYGSVGTSPYGQPYGLVIRRVSLPAPSTETVVRAVVFETNSPSATALERAGMQNTAQQVYALKAKAAAEAQKDFKLLSAILPVGTREARSPTNSFTENLADYFSSNFPANQLGALVNFGHIDPNYCLTNPSGPGCGNVGTGGGTGTACIVLPAADTCGGGTPSLVRGPVTVPVARAGGGAGDMYFRAYQACSSVREATCPYGKKLKEKIPAKCLLPLDVAANAQLTSREAYWNHESWTNPVYDVMYAWGTTPQWQYVYQGGSYSWQPTGPIIVGPGVEWLIPMSDIAQLTYINPMPPMGAVEEPNRIAMNDIGIGYSPTPRARKWSAVHSTTESSATSAGHIVAHVAGLAPPIPYSGTASIGNLSIQSVATVIGAGIAAQSECLDINPDWTEGFGNPQLTLTYRYTPGMYHAVCCDN